VVLVRAYVVVFSLVLVEFVVVGCARPLPELGDEGTSGDGDTGLVSTSGGGISSGAVDSSGGGTSSGAVETTAGSGTSSAAETTAGVEPPEAPVLELSFSQVKQFDFSWAAAVGAEYYQLLESSALGEPFGQIGGDIMVESISIAMPLHLRFDASYVLRACNIAGCTESAPVSMVGSLAEAVGYFKASNTGTDDVFGISVAMSADGNILAVGASGEDSSATGIDDDNVGDDSASDAGAVYVFVRSPMNQWSQQAYVKASNTDSNDSFGYRVALNGDGSTLAVGAYGEASNAIGIGNNQADNSAATAGAVYIFVRDGMDQWAQQAYVKASNTGSGDYFGRNVALSSDGDTLAVAAIYEDSNAIGIGGRQFDDSATDSGAIYVFTRDGMDQWSQQAYVKASNTDSGDNFGIGLALNGDGNTLAVGAHVEDSNASGIGGDPADDSTSSAGAVYVFVRDGMDQWAQQAYIKASNTGWGDLFGYSVALSGGGNTLAVGAYREESNATGIGGNQADDSATYAGAIYLY
jgi:trimeric autotransporter adhesin